MRSTCLHQEAGIDTPKTPLLPEWAKKSLALAVSAGILVYFFHDQDWRRLWAVCRRANLTLAIFAILVPQLIFWFMQAAVVARHQTWFHGPFSYRKFLWISGLGYILMFVNTAVGFGGLLWYVQRRSSITWRKLMGITLFRVGLMLWGMAFALSFSTLAMEYYGMGVNYPALRYVWWSVLLGPGIFFCVSNWLFWHHGISVTRLDRVLVKDKQDEFWTAFTHATRGQWLKTFGLTVPPFLIVMVGYYFLARAFGIRPPFIEFITVAPLAALIMYLPIAFAGFGTATLGFMAFFSEYGSSEDLAAFTLILPFGRAVSRALIGLVSFRPAMKELTTLSAPVHDDHSEARMA